MQSITVRLEIRFYGSFKGFPWTRKNISFIQKEFFFQKAFPPSNFRYPQKILSFKDILYQKGFSFQKVFPGHLKSPVQNHCYLKGIQGPKVFSFQKAFLSKRLFLSKCLFKVGYPQKGLSGFSFQKGFPFY